MSFTRTVENERKFKLGVLYWDVGEPNVPRSPHLDATSMRWPKTKVIYANSTKWESSLTMGSSSSSCWSVEMGRKTCH